MKQITLLIYLILLISACPYAAYKVCAQTIDDHKTDKLSFIGYNSKQGLSNSHVNCIGQDSKGFIWVGTNDGLNRFDGLRVRTFHYSHSDTNSVNSNTIFSIFTDKRDRIWFGTFSGICRYDYKQENFIRYNLPPQANAVLQAPVRAIAQTNDGHLWMATSGGGLARMNTETREVKYYRHKPGPQSLCSDYLQAIAVDNSGNIWVGSENNGVSILNPQTGTFRNINKETGELKSNIVLTIFKTKNGEIWIGSFEGNATVYNPDTDTFSTIKLTENNLSVFGISEGLSGDIWIGTQEKGLFNYKEKRTNHFSNAMGNVTGLINDNIHALYTDHDNNLWLGNFQGGVNMLKPSPIFGADAARNDFQLKGKTVLGILPDGKDCIYICTDGDGLYVLNTITGQSRQYTAGQCGLKSNTLRYAYKDHNNHIWIGTYLKGLQEFDPEKGTFSCYENIPGDSTSLSNNDVTSIVEDLLGNLWIGTNGGLNILDRKTGKFRRYLKDEDNPAKTIINNHITNLYVDSHGHLWISTFWGLSRLDPAKGNVKNYNIVGNDNTYYCILEDSKERFWAGTTTGLKLLNVNDGSFQVFSTSEGLPSNVIDGIVEDADGNLWLSTNQGICKFNYDNSTVMNFYTEDGLSSNEFIHNAYAQDSDGEIYFGSVDGITRFYPNKIKSSSKPPRIAITDLLVFNEKVSPNDSHGILSNSIMETSEFQMPWENNSFTIIYNAIDYIQPQKITYAYRMTGFDSQWTYHPYDQNSASYTNLNAGVYSFEVKATSDGYIWSKPIVLKINIIAPVWKRWWAIMSYIALAVAAIYFLWLYYRRSEMEKQKIKIENLRQQNDIELNKSRLQFFTNISHEFRTPLTLIMSPLEQMMESGEYTQETKAQFVLMHRNATKLLHMINQIMDIRKIDNNRLQLNPVKCDLVKFLREIYENFQQLAIKNDITFTYTPHLKEYTAYLDTELIDKVMYNLLSNAFKFTPKGGRIDMQIRHAVKGSSNNVVIIVEDNGHGIAEENIDKIFDRFYQGESSQMQQGTGIGLWLTKQFIEMHNGIISVSSELGKGTAFTIMLTDGEDFKDKVSAETTYSHLSLGNAVDDRSSEKTEVLAADGNEQSAESKPSILLVEDNTDIREYLQKGLGKLYNITTANNGAEGLSTAKQTIPDLVITDIMMPEMDGIEMCRILKNDIETCHIPVIMLTARSSEEQRIEGLETGADSYIPKPFNPKHLLVRIEKLLELRKTLREKFGNEIGFEAEQAGITIPDRDLLKKVTSVIKKRISDRKLSVETLAGEVGISRGHLQRKLKSLTGQNPNEFIRIIRLKQAAEILTENDVTIAEVADMVGFNTPSYFSTAFTKQFNISPSQYVESHRPQA